MAAYLATAAAILGVRMMLDTFGGREKINKVLESKMEKAFQDFKNKMKALQEDFKKLQSRQREVQHLRAELGKNPGNKEEKIAWALESKLRKNLWQLSPRIQTLEEDLQEWPKATRHDLLLLRAELQKKKGNKEEEIAWAMESKLKNICRQLSEIIHTLEGDLQECLETTKRDLLLLRAELQKKKVVSEAEAFFPLEW
ncbi:uncharacterized protein LOC128820908 isoform X2 [Vidua macroura]|uniref:uncharacterized protein LOC128820908 isoform X2 n=1 Tax=Vidua macroura TaxID=187451 RepID=UPI0023A80AA1|nr:uncharacterized protein LOC128820908 isoform X2 [Vidua macroura]